MKDYPKPMVTISLEEYSDLLTLKATSDKEYQKSELKLCKEVIAVFARSGETKVGFHILSPVQKELERMGIELIITQYTDMRGPILLNGDHITVIKIPKQQNG